MYDGPVIHLSVPAVPFIGDDGNRIQQPNYIVEPGLFVGLVGQVARGSHCRQAHSVTGQVQSVPFHRAVHDETDRSVSVSQPAEVRTQANSTREHIAVRHAAGGVHGGQPVGMCGSHGFHALPQSLGGSTAHLHAV